MRSRLLPLLSLVLIASAVLLPDPAAAHAVYVSSSPEACGILPTAPSAVSVTLSEPIQPGTQTIQVKNSVGAREDVGTAQISPLDPRTVTINLRPIGPDVHTVTWIVEDAVDGHWTSGFFYFMVQNGTSLPGSFPCQSAPPAPADLTEVLLRFGVFLSLAIALGGTVFGIVVWIPAGRDSETVGESMYEWGFRALLLWARLGALLFGASTGAWWVHAVTAAPSEVVPSIIASPFSLTLVLRALLGLGMAGALTFALVKSKVNRSPEGALDDATTRGGSEGTLLPLLVTAIIGVIALLAGSAGSHSAAVSLLGLGMDAIHEIGVYAWVGGLIALVRLRPWLKEAGLVPFARNLYRRFSELAGYAVALVLGAGVILGLLLVGTLDNLFGTAYGWTLLAKVSLFIPMLSLGAYNRYRILPKSSAPEAAAAPVGKLTRNVRFEATLGAIVLAIAAVLTASTPPPTTPATNAFTRTVVSDGIRFDFEVDPPPTTPGTYTIGMLLSNATTGAGVGNTSWSANLTLTFLGTPSFTVANLSMLGPHGNHFFVDTDKMSKAGTWRIDVEVDRVFPVPKVSANFYVVLG